jgi:hypothetical protein
MRKVKARIEKRKLYKSEITGRYRKLSDGEMLAIRRAYADGDQVRTLSEQFGVSTAVVYSIVYWTPQGQRVAQ